MAKRQATNRSTAVEKAQPPSIIQSTQNLHDMLYERMGEFERAIPKYVNIERLFKVAVIAHSRSPELLQCTRESIVLALMDCGQLNLEPNGILGEAYLIPRQNGKLTEKFGMRIVEAHFQPGYRGLVKLARNSGDIAYIDARPVWPGDFLEFERGSKPFLRHVEDPDNADRTDDGLVKVYSMAYFREISILPSFVVMTKKQVEKRRARSAFPKSDMWVNWYPEGAIKTAIRNHVKQLPASAELQAAVAIDEAAEIGQAMRLSEISPDYSGQLPHAELPPRVTGTRKAHDALKNVPKAEVVGDGEEPPKEPQEPPQEPQDAQEGATAEDEPLADEKAKSTVWL
ncbi:MAG: recombinase RecT, partial [Planctomycetes bacterium]|nr:recombinase RecT [Planctomycetota bacterium]